MLKLYNPSGQRIGALEHYENLVVEEEVNQLNLLSFDVPKEYSSLIEYEGYVETEHNGRYIIKEKSSRTDTMGYKAIYDLEDLNGHIESKAYVSMTLSAMMADLLNGTGWAINTSDTSLRTATAVTIDRLDLIYAIVRDTFGLEIKFDNQAKVITAEQYLGSDKGVYFHDEVNLIELQVDGDTYDFATRIIPRGADGLSIESVNGGLPYLENTQHSTKIITRYWSDERYTIPENLKAAAQAKLDVMSKPLKSYAARVVDLARIAGISILEYSPGDVITLVDRESGIKEKQRIVVRRKFLDEPERDAITIANRLRQMDDSIQTEFDGMKQDFSVIRASLQLLDQKILARVSQNEYDTDKEAMDLAYAELELSIDGLEAEVLDLEGNVSALNLSSQELEGRIQNAEGDIGLLELSASNFQVKISGIEEDLQNIELTPGPQGPSGVSVVNTDVMYYLSSSTTTLVGGSWTTSAPTWESGKFIWSKTVTFYSDGSTTESQPVNIMGAKGEPGQQGVKGDPGISIISVTEYYLASSLATGVTTGTSGWTTTMQSMTVTNKYLWNYKKITYSDNSVSTVLPVIIGVYGNTGGTGATGRSLTAVTVYYLASASSSGVTRTTPGWTTTMQSTTPTLQYLWRYEKLDWSSGTTPTYIEPIIIGVHGTRGDTGTGIDSITEEYYLSTSKTTQTGGSWVITPPAWSSGLYIWTRTKIVYKNPASTVYTTPIVSSEWEAVYSLESEVLDRFETNEAAISANNSAILLRALKTEVEAPILKQNTAPAHLNGRLWLDTSATPNVLKRSTGSAWVKVTPTSGAEIGLTDEAITQTVENNTTTLATKLEVESTSTEIVNKFSSSGGYNHIRNGDFKNGIAHFPVYWYSASPYGCQHQNNQWTGYEDALELLQTNAGGQYTVAWCSVNGLTPGKVYTFGALGAVHRGNAYLEMINYAGNQIITHSGDINSAYSGGGDPSKWAVMKSSFIATEETMYLRLGLKSIDTNAYAWFKKVRVNEGDTLLPFTPHPEELYSGVVRIDKDGVNVSRSSTDVNTQLAYNGLTISDGDISVASFGDSGAVIPKAVIGVLENSEVVKMVSNSPVMDVGSGYAYGSIQQAVNDAIQGNRRILNSVVRINVRTSVSGDTLIQGLSGEILVIYLYPGVTVNGRIVIKNCTNLTILQGQGPPWSTIKAWNPIEFVNSNVIVQSIQVDGGGGDYCIWARDGGTYGIKECDLSRAWYCYNVDVHARVHSSNTKGSPNAYPAVVSNGGELISAGLFPANHPSYNTRYINYQDTGFAREYNLIPTNSSYSPPAITSKTFTQTFTSATFDTLVHGTSNPNPYYGASAAQNRWDSSVSWCDGRIRFGPEIYNFFAGGSNIQVQIRLRRKNSSHGNSGAVMPAPYNHSASFPSGATRGGWTGWATIPSSLFTTEGATLTYYNGVQGLNGYAIWDAVEVWVSVTKNV
ncbi:phage tail protein [Proteiniclasticum ruminis]|uniref:phage tail protein n=1 Tax=Proteiniclasticum ruminis TaxID=398199 RepID=UPI0028AFF338|nr:phage tail spike protein [Proteiniclasticum ruminis]